MSRSGHAWTRVGVNRERCTSCRAIRSWNGGPAKAWTYCAVGGDPVSRDPGCPPQLPGLTGAPFVDGEDIQFRDLARFNEKNGSPIR